MGDIIVYIAIGLNISATIAYGLQGDYSRMFYWMGAVVVAGSTLFIGGK